MEQNLYLIFNETYDDLCMLSASLYNDVNEGILDFHRIYVFLNYRFLRDIIEKEFYTYINDIDDYDDNVDNFTLKFKIPDIKLNTKTYIKLVLNEINKHPDILLNNVTYQDECNRDEVYELYLHTIKRLISQIEWLNK